MGNSAEKSGSPRKRETGDSPRNAPNPIARANLQFVYKQAREGAFEKENLGEGIGFHLVSTPIHLLRHIRPLLAYFGITGFAKALAKTATRRRLLYLLVRGNRVAHIGWLNIGFCNYYEVDPGDVVIGPIWSDKSMRGKGLATEGLKRAMGAMLAGGRSVFYIDTSADNIPAQKAIAKAGFGKPVANYIETPEGWLPLEQEDT